MELFHNVEVYYLPHYAAPDPPPMPLGIEFLSPQPTNAFPKQVREVPYSSLEDSHSPDPILLTVPAQSPKKRLILFVKAVGVIFDLKLLHDSFWVGCRSLKCTYDHSSCNDQHIDQEQWT
jgi:hypothetical protein